MHVELPKLPRSRKTGPEQPIGRAENDVATSAQDVRVDHRGLQIAVAEQLLDRPNIVSGMSVSW